MRKLAYIRLNRQTPCPPRGAVPVYQACCGRFFHSQHAVRIRSWRRPFRLCRSIDYLFSAWLVILIFIASATGFFAPKAFGLTIGQTDANGHTTTFRYDALGRRTGRTLPGGQSEGSYYDPLTGNLIYQTNFNGVVITNGYDVANRLTNSASVNGYRVSYGYNVTNGWRTNLVDASGTTVWRYNAVGQLTNKVVVWANGPVATLNYGYDALGSLTNLWSGTANGVTNAYQYDLLGRLTNVLANGSAAAGYGFDKVGNLQTMRYGNGVTNGYQYDAQNRLTNQVWKLNNTAVAGFAYTLGPTGNRTNLVETVATASRTYTWAYDYLYRLTGETISGAGTVNYGYDVVGNRTNRASNISQLTNAVSSYTANDWLASDSYDANGSTTASSGNSYQYDALNHLTNANNGTVLMTYDGDGNRASKKVGGTTTYYLLDDRNPSGYVQVLEEWTVTSTATNLGRVYNYGLALISQRVPNSSTNYFICDGHGSTRALMDSGGNVVNTFAYDAYGTLIASNGLPQTAYLYCGQQYDSDLGMYLNRARYLNAGTGRFWTMDSFEGDDEDPLSLHKYLYCQGNPIMGIDPSGQADGDVGSLSFSMGTMAGLAGLTLTGIAAANVYSHGALVQAAWNETMTDTSSAMAAAEAALSVARTSVRQLISDAREALRQTGKALKNIKVIPMPRSVIPDVADHVVVAQVSGKPIVLRRAPDTQYKINRRLAIGSHPPAAPGNSLDEYPFAASLQGGVGASIKEVPAWQNSLQGAIIRWSYKFENIGVGRPYIVLVTP